MNLELGAWSRSRCGPSGQHLGFHVRAIWTMAISFEGVAMIRVITIDREYGSGAADIAKIVAERLGWKLWDQLLTNHIARLLDCDCGTVEKREEKLDPVFYRLFRAFMRGSYEGSLNAPRLKIVDADCIREVAEKVV